MHSTNFTFSHIDLLKRVHIASVLVSILMVVLGVFSFLFILNLDDRTSTWSMAALVLGTVLVLVGVFRLCWKSQQLVYAPTGSVVCERLFFLDAQGLEAIQLATQSGDWSGVAKVKILPSGNIRMNAVVSDDRMFIAFQLFQYVPYTYQSVTPVYYYIEEQAKQLVSLLERR